MLSQELQTPAQMTVWSEGAFSSARHKLHITANDDGDIVTGAHRRLPDHMIVATDSASIAPISLPIEHGFTSFQTAQTEQVENADARAMQADLEHHVEAEQHESTATHHDEQLQQHQVLQHQQQLANDNHQEQQREQPQQQRQQQQLTQPDHQQGQLQEQQQEQQEHEQQMHHAQEPETHHSGPEQSVQQQHFVQTDVAAGNSDGVQRETPRKRSGSNRRKRYRCGYCHELGHNQKTCPLRPPHLPTSTSRSHAQRTSMPDTAQLQHVAAKVAEELSRVFFEMAPAHSGDEWQPPQQISYDTVLEAANKEVTQANQSVADAKTDQEFDNAVDHLHSAVCMMEKVAVLIYKSAALAHTLSRNVEDPS